MKSKQFGLPIDAGM